MRRSISVSNSFLIFDAIFPTICNLCCETTTTTTTQSNRKLDSKTTIYTIFINSILNFWKWIAPTSITTTVFPMNLLFSCSDNNKKKKVTCSFWLLCFFFRIQMHTVCVHTLSKHRIHLYANQFQSKKYISRTHTCRRHQVQTSIRKKNVERHQWNFFAGLYIFSFSFLRTQLL